MLTPVISSLIATEPSPLQSPAHCAGAAAASAIRARAAHADGHGMVSTLVMRNLLSDGYSERVLDAGREGDAGAVAAGDPRPLRLLEDVVEDVLDAELGGERVLNSVTSLSQTKSS